MFLLQFPYTTKVVAVHGGEPNYDVYEARAHAEHKAAVEKMTELNSPFQDTEALLKPFEMIKNNGAGHGFLIAITALKRAPRVLPLAADDEDEDEDEDSCRTVLKRRNDGDIEDLSASADAYCRLSRYLPQLFLPRSADMYPLASDGAVRGGAMM